MVFARGLTNSRIKIISEYDIKILKAKSHARGKKTRITEAYILGARRTGYKN